MMTTDVPFFCLWFNSDQVSRQRRGPNATLQKSNQIGCAALVTVIGPESTNNRLGQNVNRYGFEGDG